MCHYKSLDIALFGGTFDPVHKAHLAVARAARDRLGFDTVLMIPAAVQPHKLHRITESWEHRYRMVELACAGEDRIEASDLEAGTARSYTIDTVGRLRAAVGQEPNLWFIIGADAFAEIATWHRSGDLIRELQFVVVARPGHEYEIPEGARVRVLSSVNMDVSSSAIREKLLRGEQPEELPPPVFEYIREHGLYAFGCGAESPPVARR